MSTHLGTLPEPRVERTKAHLLVGILPSRLCAVPCGGEGWTDMATFGQARESWLRRDLANARWLAERVDATPGWERLPPVLLQTVCVRHCPPGLDGSALDAHTLGRAARINASGRGYLTPALLDGRWMVRVSIGAEPTERADVAVLWEVMRAEAEGAGGNTPPAGWRARPGPAPLALVTLDVDRAAGALTHSPSTAPDLPDRVRIRTLTGVRGVPPDEAGIARALGAGAPALDAGAAKFVTFDRDRVGRYTIGTRPGRLFCSG